MRRFLLSTFLLFNLVSVVSASLALQSKSSAAVPTQASAQNALPHPDHAKPTGQEVFQANCGRCHMPPMVVSPRLTGTVVMHMRARARLSRQDEQLLLKYMAP